MSIEFRRARLGDSAQPVRDFELDAVYAPNAKFGDIVKLNATGKVVAAATNDILVLGVFLGKNPKLDVETVVTGKVRTSSDAIYEVTVTGAGPTVGKSYPATLTAGEYNLNSAVETTPLFTVLGVYPNGNAEVVFKAGTLQA